MRRLMCEASAILGISAQGVPEFGNVLPEPGGEAQRLESLPDASREKRARSA